MSDRTQGSVRTEGDSSNEDPQTAAIPSEEPAAGKPAAKPAAAAPGWGGATPSAAQGPATSQNPAAKPVGQSPAGPTQPAAGKPAGARPAGAKQGPAKQVPSKQAPPKQAPQGQPGVTVGARAAAPQTGSRPANRDAGAPRQGASRPPAAGARPAESPLRTAAEGDRPAGVRGSGGGKGPRRARLQLRHIDTWSALKISLVLAIALFFVWMVAVGVLYGVLNGLGVFSTLNDLIGQLGSSSGDGARADVISPGIVFGGAAVIGAVNIVLFTALCTVGTFIYNLCADLVGGLEVTLSERD
jgi:hypothetical protein